MPTLIVENVPADVFERLRQKAANGKRTLPEETLHLLIEALEQEKPTPRLPEYVPNEEISAPCDLPRSSRPVSVVARSGKERLPDPLVE
jgi:hypothetical protein